MHSDWPRTGKWGQTTGSWNGVIITVVMFGSLSQSSGLWTNEWRWPRAGPVPAHRQFPCRMVKSAVHKFLMSARAWKQHDDTHYVTNIHTTQSWPVFQDFPAMMLTLNETASYWENRGTRPSTNVFPSVTNLASPCGHCSIFHGYHAHWWSWIEWDLSRLTGGMGSLLLAGTYWNHHISGIGCICLRLLVHMDLWHAFCLYN